MRRLVPFSRHHGTHACMHVRLNQETLSNDRSVIGTIPLPPYGPGMSVDGSAWLLQHRQAPPLGSLARRRSKGEGGLLGGGWPQFMAASVRRWGLAGMCCSRTAPFAPPVPPVPPVPPRRLLRLLVGAGRSMHGIASRVARLAPSLCSIGWIGGRVSWVSRVCVSNVCVSMGAAASSTGGYDAGRLRGGLLRSWRLR